MSVTLNIISGPSIGRRIFIRRGQIAKVGRTERADFSIPGDSDMVEVHFAIETVGPRCLIRNLSDAAETLVNGAAVSQARLQTGDTVTAGQTAFQVTVEGDPTPGREEDEEDADAASSPPNRPPAPPQAADYCRPLKMTDPANDLLQDGMSPGDYLSLLIEKELYPDALRFLAFWLPKPVAVGWGCDCVQEVTGGKLATADQAALSAARAWAKAPTEPNRRAAESAATQTQFSGPASWLALGAFWSGGSLAAPDLPPVPPPEALTAEALTGSLMMVATQNEPMKATNRYQTFLRTGQQLIPKPATPGSRP